MMPEALDTWAHFFDIAAGLGGYPRVGRWSAVIPQGHLTQQCRLHSTIGNHRYISMEYLSCSNYLGKYAAMYPGTAELCLPSFPRVSDNIDKTASLRKARLKCCGRINPIILWFEAHLPGAWEITNCPGGVSSSFQIPRSLGC